MQHTTCFVLLATAEKKTGGRWFKGGGIYGKKLLKNKLFCLNKSSSDHIAFYLWESFQENNKKTGDCLQLDYAPLKKPEQTIVHRAEKESFNMLSNLYTL